MPCGLSHALRREIGIDHAAREERCLMM